MKAFSKIVEFNCQFCLKTSTKLHKRTIDINSVTQWVNHNTNKADSDKYTFL